MTCMMMTSLGVYVLGAAEHEERRKVEAHLPQCQSCRAELIRLAPIPGLLAVVPPDAAARLRRDAAVQPDSVRPAAARRAARSRSAHRIRPGGRLRVALRAGRWPRARLAGSAAGLGASLAAAAALITGPWGASPPAQPGGHPAAPVTLSGTSRNSHVHATARLLATSWGTSIRLTVSGVPLNVRCRLVVRSTAGGTETTGLWDAWREGPITVPASAAWRPSDIASLAVVAGTRTLVTMSSARLTPPGSSSQSGR